MRLAVLQIFILKKEGDLAIFKQPLQKKVFLKPLEIKKSLSCMMVKQ